MTYPEIQFMNDMREQFGEFEFRAKSDKTIVESKGCPVNPKHPFNRPDSEYVVPALRHDQEDDA
jgi:hypothetical protein